MRHIAYYTSPIIHVTWFCGLACRASCSGSAGYVTRAVCVVSAITIIVNQLITNCLNQEPTPNPSAGGDPFCSTFLPSLSFRVLHAVYRSSALCSVLCALSFFLCAPCPASCASSPVPCALSPVLFLISYSPLHFLLPQQPSALILKPDQHQNRVVCFFHIVSQFLKIFFLFRVFWRRIFKINTLYMLLNRIRIYQFY